MIERPKRFGSALPARHCCQASPARTKRSCGTSVGSKSIRKASPLHLVELCVDEHPAALGCVPIFRDPMIFETAWVEICAEAAPRTCGHALFAQDRGEESREVPAHAGHPLFGRSALMKRLRAPFDFLDHPGHRADIRKIAPFAGELQLVKPGRNVAMNQQPLDDLTERQDVTRQTPQRRCCLAGAIYWVSCEVKILSLGQSGSSSIDVSGLQTNMPYQNALLDRNCGGLFGADGMFRHGFCSFVRPEDE